MNVVIIEDERILADRLQNMLMEISPDIKVIGRYESVESILNGNLEYQDDIDVIFSDIRLSDGIVFDALSKIKNKVNIIFVTAYNEFAIEAFKHNGIDYILKPFSKDSLIKAVNRAKQLSPVSLQKKLANLDASPTKQYKLIYICEFKGGTAHIIETSNIKCFALENGIVKISTTDDKQYRIYESLEKIQSELNPQQFFRANRQYIININSVDKIINLWNRKLEIKIKSDLYDDKKIIVSKEHKAEFMDWISGKLTIS